MTHLTALVNKPVTFGAIMIEVRNVYGNETIYPACEVSTKFAHMLGQKTLTRKNLKDIAAIGFDIQTKPQDFKL